MMRKKVSILKSAYLIFCFCSFALIPAVIGFSETAGVMNILNPQLHTEPNNLIFYMDQAGAANIAFQYMHENIPNEISYIRRSSEIWSAPVSLKLDNWSNVILCDTVNLSDMTPVMLLLGDNADYAQIFDLTDINSGDNIPEKLGIPEEELNAMLVGNQHLFVSYNFNGRWSEPIDIPDTYGASKAIMAAGADSDALVLFYKDSDKNIETIDDIDLYATVFNKGTWSKPLRLTNDDKVDYSAQVTYINNEYLVVWVSDDDNDMETVEDKLLHYAVLGSDGSEITGQNSIVDEFQIDTVPVLGQYNDNAVLLWTSETLSDTDMRRPIWEMKYNNGWLPKETTGLLTYQMGSGRLFKTGDSLVFIYRAGASLQTAVTDGEGWFSGGTLINFNLLALNVSSVAFYPDVEGDLHIGMTGYVSAKDDSSENEFDGIYYTRRSLACDLTINYLDVSPRKKKIGQDIEITFDIYNYGYMRSGDYDVLIKQDQEVMATLEGESLPSGEGSSFSYELLMDKTTMNFELEIVTDSLESSKENNLAKVTAKVLPDYSVRSVKRIGNDRIAARIVENKGIASPRVNVDFYAVIEGESEKIGSSTYDPIADELVEISWQNVASLTGPYQLVAEVNHDRHVGEDEYANNKGSFIFNPLPDFVVDSFMTSKDSISVAVSNIGEKEVSNADVLITDSPEVVTAHDIDDVVGDLHYYQELELDENQKANVTINYDGLNSIKDRRIYAIVNPGGNIAESDQNNNLATTLVKLRNELPSASSRLLFGAVFGSGSNITVTLVNTGNEPVVASRLELVNNNGNIVKQEIIPVVKSRGWKRIMIKDVENGSYVVRLITNISTSTPDILEKSVNL